MRFARLSRFLRSIHAKYVTLYLDLLLDCTSAVIQWARATAFGSSVSEKTYETELKMLIILLAISVAHRKNDHFNNIDLLKFFSIPNSYRAMACACWAYYRGPAEKWGGGGGGRKKYKNVFILKF